MKSHLIFCSCFSIVLKVNEHSPTGHIAGESTACYVWKVMCLDQNHLLVKLYRNISLIYALVTLEHNIQQLPSRRFNGEFLVDYYFFFIIFLQNLSIESMKIKSKKISSNSRVYLLSLLSAFLLF